MVDAVYRYDERLFACYGCTEERPGGLQQVLQGSGTGMTYEGRGVAFCIEGLRTRTREHKTASRTW